MSLEAVFTDLSWQSLSAGGWKPSTQTWSRSRCIWSAWNKIVARTKLKREKQVPVFLNLFGRETYALLRNLVSLVKPAEKSLDELMGALRGHFERKKLVTAARFQFHQRQQQAGESVSTYLAELRKIAFPCDFGDSLSESLKDRLVCGLSNEAHQKRLLLKQEL